MSVFLHSAVGYWANSVIELSVAGTVCSALEVGCGAELGNHAEVGG